MKTKLLTLLLSLILALSAAGCASQPGGTDSSSETAGTSSEENTSSENDSSQEEPSAGDSSDADSSETTGSAQDDMSLEEIMEQIYAGVPADQLPMVGNTEITAETENYYLGTEGLGFTEALASDAMINAIAHSVCLIRMPEGADIEAAKEDIRTHVNPQRWICVGVDADKVVVDSIGNVIVLILNNDLGKQLHENFLALAGNAQ